MMREKGLGFQNRRNWERGEDGQQRYVNWEGGSEEVMEGSKPIIRDQGEEEMTGTNRRRD